MPDRPNPYLVPSWPKTFLSRDLWNSVFGDVDNRLGLVEQKAASFAALEAQGIQASLDYIQANVAEQLVTLQHSITLAQDQIEQITIGGKIPNALLPGRLRAGLEGGLTDCNLFIENGWAFAGPSAINRPPGIDFALLHYRGDTANGQQWGQDVFSGIKYRRRLDSFNWQAWRRVYEAEAELDARYNRLSQTILNEQLPKRLGEFCYAITDWNEARKNGCYMADGAAHAPTPAGWYVGYTLAHNDLYFIQRASGLFDGTTWERICTNNSFPDWVRVRTREWELDERYNRLGVAISKDQLPGIMAPTRFDSYVSARAGSGSENGYIQMSSGNSQVTGGLELWQANGQRTSYFGYADTTNKNINITAENGYRFSFNTSGGRLPAIDGQDIRTAATAYAKSETYTQAETQSLVTTARRVRLGGIGEIGTTTFQWNEAPAGCVLTGAFVDGNWGVRNIRYRGLHQTDLSGNWVVVAQS